MRYLLLSVLVVCVIGVMVPSVFAEVYTEEELEQMASAEIQIDHIECVVWENPNNIHISFQGTVSGIPMKFFGIYYLYDKDMDLIQEGLLEENDFGKIGSGIDTRITTSYRVIDEGMGLIQIFPSTGGATFSKDAILNQKLEIDFYHIQSALTPIQVNDGIFEPSEVTINFGDGIELVEDCNDCYKYQWTEYSVDSNIVGKVLGTPYSGHSFSEQKVYFKYPAGTYKIVDMFQPENELTINVRTVTESQNYNSQESGNDVESNQMTESGTQISENKIPGWVKNIFIWYSQDQISEDEVLNAIKFLVNQGIINLNE